MWKIIVSVVFGHLGYFSIILASIITNMVRRIRRVSDQFRYGGLIHIEDFIEASGFFGYPRSYPTLSCFVYISP